MSNSSISNRPNGRISQSQNDYLLRQREEEYVFAYGCQDRHIYVFKEKHLQTLNGNNYYGTLKIIFENQMMIMMNLNSTN